MKLPACAVAVSIALALVAPSGVFAQGEKKSDKYPALILGSAIKGTDVMNKQNETLGEVEEVLVEPRTGRIRFVVLQVGGFLGLGATEVAVPWGAFELSKEGDKPKWVLDATKERLEKAPKVEGKAYDRLYVQQSAEPVFLYWKQTWIAEP